MEHNHLVSAAALVTDDRGRILLVNSPWRGWEYPGGLLEPGETVIQALRREIREEAGVEVQVLRFVGVCKNVEKNIVNMDFVCRYVSGELTPSQESTQVIWATEAEAFDLITFPPDPGAAEEYALRGPQRPVLCLHPGALPDRGGVRLPCRRMP